MQRLRLRRARRGDQPVQGLEGACDVAAIDGIRQVEAAGRTELTQVLLDVREVEHRVVAVRRPPQIDELGDATRVVAEMLGDAGRRSRRELQARALQLALQHLGGLLGRRTDDLGPALAHLVERRGHAPTPRHEHEMHVGKRVFDPADEPPALVGGETADVAHDDDARAPS